MRANIVFKNWVQRKKNDGVLEKELSSLPSNNNLGKFHLYHYFLHRPNFKQTPTPAPESNCTI